MKKGHALERRALNQQSLATAKVGTPIVWKKAASAMF
jgi:hypothetical protein